MPMSKKNIVELIKKNMPDAIIDIEDLRGDQNHYHATIKSSLFNGLSRIQQHQLFYKYIGSHMGTTLHALKLTTTDRKD